MGNNKLILFHYVQYFKQIFYIPYLSVNILWNNS